MDLERVNSCWICSRLGNRNLILPRQWPKCRGLRWSLKETSRSLRSKCRIVCTKWSSASWKSQRSRVILSPWSIPENDKLSSLKDGPPSTVEIRLKLSRFLSRTGPSLKIGIQLRTVSSKPLLESKSQQHLSKVQHPQANTKQTNSINSCCRSRA